MIDEFDAGESVLVAVKLAKIIPRSALVWALTHVVRPGGLITLLVVVPSKNSGRRIWGLKKFAGDCGGGHRRFAGGGSIEVRSDIAETCSQLMLQLQSIYDSEKTKVKIKIVGGTPVGAVAAESKKAQASWVVLDKQLKLEEKFCMEELQCNIVAMKRSRPKILRLNLLNHNQLDSDGGGSKNSSNQGESTRGPVVTPSSSPEPGTTFTTEAGASSVSSCDVGTSPSLVPRLIHKLKNDPPSAGRGSDTSNSLSEVEAKTLAAKFGKLDPSLRLPEAADIREAISLTRCAPQVPPPLCSRCQHKAPVFGKPPQWFSFSELMVATNGFSEANFLAEGGFGSVHRGVLPDGQVVAVKQHRLAGSQGDTEFCSEVEVLSCAQHRNVVMLIGFCIEDGRRLLVYEYICNGSLDSHLYGRKEKRLEWWARQKIAMGAAKGLRYLHEECRVGCIVHRDMRPNNILITHDFEPLVGDFGLARWQPDGDLAVETRVIGTFGYLAPEYAQSGQVTEKADVYSFGVVLMELVTGRKAVDINRPKGQQCLTEWARPLLEEQAVKELIDPSLGGRYVEEEVCRMVHVAAQCIQRDPDARPRMSQVLRILDGDGVGLQRRPQSPYHGTMERRDIDGLSFRRCGGMEERLSSAALLAAYREKSRRYQQ